MNRITPDKIGSATSRLKITGTLIVDPRRRETVVGDVVAVRALSESLSYGNLELPNGRLAKINRGDVIVGVLGNRRALKGFVGNVPRSVGDGDRLHLLNMGGVIGNCSGHHSSLSDAIEVEVIGSVCADDSTPLNLSSNALRPSNFLRASVPIVFVAGACMNSGKTVAATEIVKQATRAGLKVAAAKLSGIACLRDTLNMEDHGAIATASFLDCGLPSTVDCGNLAPVAKAVINHLNTFEPDIIVAELGDGIIGGYSVDSVLRDEQIRSAISSFVFCAADYVGIVGGKQVLGEMGLAIDVAAGSVTDSQMGEDFIQDTFGIKAGNAQRNGQRLFRLIKDGIFGMPEVATAA
jgi:hypothetical protein